MKKSFFAAAALMIGVGFGSGAVGADRFGDWDKDRDLYVGEREWDEGFTADGVFDAWDLDDDGVLSRTEFNSQLFRAYDASRDRRLSLEEFGAFEEDRGEGGIFAD